jgi:hypothetical protein
MQHYFTLESGLSGFTGRLPFVRFSLAARARSLYRLGMAARRDPSIRALLLALPR